MKLALLYILLVTGEAGVEFIDADVCQRVPHEISQGISVTVDLEDGRHVSIASAACFDIDPIGDCGDEA